MNCEKYSELISSYIDGELEELDRVNLEKHIASCHSCREELQIFKEITNDIKTIEMIDLPKGFHTDLMEKIRRENIQMQGKVIPLPLNKKKWYKTLKVASAVAAVFIFSTILLDPLNINMPKESVQEVEDNMATPHIIMEPEVELPDNLMIEETSPVESSEDLPEISQASLPVDLPEESAVNPPVASSPKQPETSQADSVANSQADSEEVSPAKLDVDPLVKSVPRMQQEPAFQGAAFSGEEIVSERISETWIIETPKHKEYKEAISNIAEEMGLEVITLETQNMTQEITLDKDQKAKLESKIKEIDETVNMIIQKQKEEHETEQDHTIKIIIIIN